MLCLGLVIASSYVVRVINKNDNQKIFFKTSMENMETHLTVLMR